MARQRPRGRARSTFGATAALAILWGIAGFRILGPEFVVIDRLHDGDIGLKAQATAGFVGWSLLIVGAVAALLFVSLRVAAYRERMVAARFPKALLIRAMRDPQLETSMKVLAGYEAFGVGDIRPAHPTLVFDATSIRLVGGIANLRPWLTVPREMVSSIYVEDRSIAESDRFFMVFDVDLPRDQVRVSVPILGLLGSPYRRLTHDNLDSFAERAGLPLRSSPPL